MMIVSYVKTILRLRKELKKQKIYIKNFLNPYLGELENKYSGSFTEEQFKKISDYYGLFIPAVLCSSYKQLYGEQFSGAERKRTTLFGILTPVGDDLFDIDKLDAGAINEITYRPQQYKATTFSAHVATEIQSFMLANVSDKTAYLQAAKNVFEIQLETIQQTNPEISDEALERITFAKGGYSVIIYHEVLERPAGQAMWEVLFYVGSLMQLGNDLFDMYKDLRDGIVTLPNRCGDYRILRQSYLARVKECNGLIDGLPYPQQRKEQFAIAMHLITSRSMVVFDKMIHLEDLLGRPLDHSKLSRQQLVCDMEKPRNILRWLYYSYQLPKII